MPNLPAEEFDAVLSGAGISMDPPSSLPSGDALASALWSRLIDSDSSMTPEQLELCSTVGPLIPDRTSGIRLEMLAELCGRSLPLSELVCIYGLVDPPEATVNSNHLAFASLPYGHHLTVNIDLMLERAGIHEVVHLHGRADEPESIVTTIGQYISQLSPVMQGRFAECVRGRRLLVAGYSGRDFDVFPLLSEHPPSAICWILHPNEDLAPEVDAGLRNLEAKCDVRVLPVVLSDFLTEQCRLRGISTDNAALRARTDGPSRVSPEIAIQSTFTAFEPEARHLAIGRVMFELGLVGRVQLVTATP